MKVITLLNEKGGVGKTTMATHIAAGLAIKGYRVILADADPQGHATVAMGLEKEPMLHDLLVRDLPFKDALRRIKPNIYSSDDNPAKGDLYVIPSDASARVIPLMVNDVMVVRNRFAELDKVVDYVIFDTAPTPSLLHGSIYIVTDMIIYPTKCEYLSFDGLAESFSHRQQASSTRQQFGLGEIKIAGIIPTMFRANTQADEYGLEMLRQKFSGLVWPEIPLRTVWSQASFARRVLFNFAPDSHAAADAWETVSRAEQFAS